MTKLISNFRFINRIFKTLNKNQCPIFLIVGIVSLFFVPSYSGAFSNVNLIVAGCNNNNICEAPVENNLICSNDCTPCNNNTVCELLKGESPISCPSDCQVISRRSSIGTSSTPVVVEGKILNLNIKTGINYAIISWDTDIPSLGSVSWGIGDSYNDGIINSIQITTHHEIVIGNLSANTKYFYIVNSSLPEYYDAKYIGIFTTLPIPEIKIIPSIYNLTATPTSDEIVLNWNNPEDKDFYGVKIVRSPFFFPIDPFEGKIVYEGKGTYTRDSDVIFGKKYYYSAFSYDKDFNFSIGVLVESLLKSKQASSSQDISVDLENENINILPTDILSMDNFIFVQRDLELPTSSSTIRVYPFNDLKIIIDANRFPTEVKSLILRIYDSSDTPKFFSYSFSLDPTKKFFYIVIPNLGNNRTYPFSVISYGLDNKESFILKGFFDVRALKESEPYSLFGLITPLSFEKPWFIYAIIIILVMFLLYKRRKKNVSRSHL